MTSIFAKLRLLRRSFIYPFLVFLALLTAGIVSAAWSGPCLGGSPSACNAAGPLDQSNTSQSKLAGLLLNTNNNPTGLVVQYGTVGIGQTAPNGRLDISSNGGSDGLVITGPADNTENIQSYIDGHWSDRTTYGGGCCNILNINTDVGQVSIGNNAANNSVNLVGNVKINSVSICQQNGTGCPATAAHGFGGAYATGSNGNCTGPGGDGNALYGGNCSCPPTYTPYLADISLGYANGGWAGYGFLYYCAI